MIAKKQSIKKFIPILFYPSLIVWFLVFLSLLDRVLSEGRGAFSLFYDDVTYALIGQQLAIEASVQGWAAVYNWITNPPHAPVSEGLSFISHWISPSFTEGLYITNVIITGLLTIWLGSLIFMAWHSRVLFSAIVMASPFGFVFANEYRPDVWFIMLASIALTASLASFDVPFLQRRKTAYLVVSIILLMCFIKPSWIVIAFFTGAASAIGFIRFDANKNYSRFQYYKSLLGPLLLLLVGLGIWFIWLSNSFFSYVIDDALNMEYRLAGSGLQSVSDSISSAMMYLGNTSFLWLIIIVLGLASNFILFSRQQKTNRLENLTNVAWGLIFWVAAGGTIAATWYSTHPSPFQGLFVIWILSIWGGVTITQNIKTTNFSFSESGKKLIYVIPVGLIALLLPTFFQNGLTYPELFRQPNSPPQQVAKAINYQCLIIRDCTEGGMGASVLVTIMEDFSPASVEYYLQADDNLNHIVSQPSEQEMDHNKVAELAKDYEFVVLRRTNFYANKIPLNAIQEQIISELRSSNNFLELPESQKLKDYIIFVNEKLAPSHS